MGRTVPSFRYVLASEKSEWKPFRDALDRKEKREFDDMWDIARLYISACSNSVQLVPLDPIVMSILFHHYKELLECKREVEFLGHRSITAGMTFRVTFYRGNDEKQKRNRADTFFVITVNLLL